MNVVEIGGIVRSYRRASGISQKDLAHMVGISRATLNYLESGRDIEIGAGKLLAIVTVLGVPFSVPEEVSPDVDESVLAAALADMAIGPDGGADKAGPLTVSQVVQGLATGRPPGGQAEAVHHFLETVTEPIAVVAVRVAAAGSGHSAKAVWKGGRSLAKAVGCSRTLWTKGPDA